jgi:gas vesicle protein
MADHHDLPYIVIERRSGAVAPFLWGALIGAAVALIWAPRSGRETQEELQGAVDRLGSALRSRVDDARESVVEAVDGVRHRVQDRVEAVRDAVENRAEGVRHAVESGRQAAREAREELEHRVSEAKRAATQPSASPGVPGVPGAPDAHTEVDVDVVITEVVEERPPRG